MIDWSQLILLSLIQGLSEFLPISSSAHLVLPSQLLGWSDQGLLFDIAVHLGTLIALSIYFWRDLIVLLGDIYPPLTATLPSQVNVSRGEFWRLSVATLPTVVVGALFNDFIEAHLRVLPVIATTTIVFGLLLGWSIRFSQYSLSDDGEDAVGWRDAIIIGFAQVLALMPGVSRSGITITAGLFLGYTPMVATRFSFFLSIPVIAGAMLFMGIHLFAGEAVVRFSLGQLFIAMSIAGVSAYASIALFFGLLARIGLMPFVWYRLALGVVLTVVIFS